MLIPHFENVDRTQLEAVFFQGRLHRAILRVRFRNRDGGKTLCAIGQNPSNANEDFADMTMRFLEKYVFKEMPEYGQLLMLNLCSRVDSKKEHKHNVNSSDAEQLLHKTIAEHNDFLIVFGKLRNRGAYKFRDCARRLQPLLGEKNVRKFDIGTDYAPHPGSRKIVYRNTKLKLARYDFSDIVPKPSRVYASPEAMRELGDIMPSAPALPEKP